MPPSSPEWRLVYLCGYPAIPLRLLVDLFFQTRLASLAGYRTLRFVRRP